MGIGWYVVVVVCVAKVRSRMNVSKVCSDEREEEDEKKS